MSDGITVSIRYGHEGREHVTRLRDMSRISGLLAHPAFIEGSDRYIGDYATEETPYVGHGLVAPDEEGLIAIDVPSRKIVVLEEHRTCIGTYSEFRFDSVVNRGHGPHRSRWETEAAWSTLMSEGRVRLRVIWEKDFRGLDDDAIRELTILSRYREPVSLEVMTSIPHARARLKAMKNLEYSLEPTQGRRPSIDEVLVDLAPWSIERFPMTEVGLRGLRERLVQMGFAKPGADEAIWKEWEERAAGDGGDTEMLAVMMAEAPVVAPLDLVEA